jgi:NADH pyrophosphatase NudC (nudix superfamily)
MLGFEAQAASSEIRTGTELAEARWFHHADMADAIARGELGISPALSIAYFLIDRWYHERTGLHLQPGASTMARG